MAKFVSKPVKVDAVQYEPPSTADSDDGNIAAVASFGAVEVTEQVPWNPAESQNCVHVSLPEDENDSVRLSERYIGMLSPGDYLVKDGDGALSVVDRETFEAAYNPVKSGAKTDD